MHESPEDAGVGYQQQLGLERELQLALVGVGKGGEAAPGAQLPLHRVQVEVASPDVPSVCVGCGYDMMLIYFKCCLHLTGHINIRLMEKAAMKTTVSQCSSLVPSLTSPVAWRTYTNLRKKQ